MPTRRWSDEQLTAAVAASRTLSEVMRRLGLSPGRYDGLRGHIKRLGIDASHIRSVEGSVTRRPRGWRDDELPIVVARSTSYAEVMRELGYEPSGGIHRWLKARIREQGISTDHFLGKGWARGRTIAPRHTRPLHEVLVRGSTYSSAALRQRLVKEGLLRRPAASIAA